MSFARKELFKKILDEYKTLKFNSEKELDIRKNDIYSKIPKIKDIDDKLYELGLSLSKKILYSDNSKDNNFSIKEIEKKSFDLKMQKGELLTTNGYPSDYLTIKYKCNVCKDTGFVHGQKCQCFKKRLIKLAYEKSNLNTLLDSQNFDNFDLSYYSDSIDQDEELSPLDNIKDIYNKCIYFVNNFNNLDINILMYGPTGLGKTYLSSCIAQALIKKGKTVFYQSAYNIFEIIESYKFNKNPESSYLLKEQVDGLYEVDLLIIDDLGTEFINSFTNATFFNLINTRMLNKKKIIINTNLMIEQLPEIYSDRVMSRILDKYMILHFFGDDIRKLKMQQ